MALFVDGAVVICSTWSKIVPIDLQPVENKKNILWGEIFLCKETFERKTRPKRGLIIHAFGISSPTVSICLAWALPRRLRIQTSRHSSVSCGEKSGNAAPPAPQKRGLQGSEGRMTIFVVSQVRYSGRETDL